MYANSTFKNPFTDFDFSKIAGEFKFPMVNVETVVETGRKNFAAVTTASTAAVESMKSIAENLTQYAAYHRDRRNIATHFVGVPMIVFCCVTIGGLMSLAIPKSPRTALPVFLRNTFPGFTSR